MPHILLQASQCLNDFMPREENSVSDNFHFVGSVTKDAAGKKFNSKCNCLLPPPNLIRDNPLFSYHCTHTSAGKKKKGPYTSQGFATDYISTLFVKQSLVCLISSFSLRTELSRLKLNTCFPDNTKRREKAKMTSLVSQEPGLATIPESPTGENNSPRRM